MHNLGTIIPGLNYHLIINEREQNDLVNALAFFHAIFDPKRSESTAALIKEWRDVAADTYLPGVDALATKIATLS